MQNFRNNPVPPALPPGFSGGSAVGGGNTSYLSQSSGPQCSPRMAEEYAVVQQQTQQNPQRQNQHPHQLVTHHPTHPSHILGYGGRNRGSGTGEALHSHSNSGVSSNSNNPYRKEMMDHYFSMSGKDRHRRGSQGLGYGLGFGYPNMDGHMPHQYRHAGAGSSGMMAHYQLDYSAAAGSGGSGNSGSSSGAGAFSPSHQYSLSQSTSIQTTVGPAIHSRQQAQNYPSQQALNQGQQHRGYPTSGHRLPLQFSLYSSPNAPTGTPGMYNSPPLRYHGGSNSAGFECKVNSSSANTNPSSVSSANSNNTGPIDSVGQSYPSSSYSPYHSQPSHSHHKHPAHPQRGSHHNLTLAYDTSHKIHSSSLLHQSPAPGLTDTENRTASSAVPSTNPSMPHLSSQEISKSPMHSQSHQPQVHQNFSPISNPSPAASTVQSPSCSSSPSPLMGISEPGNSTGPPTHAPSHPPIQKTRNSHSHSRLLQTVSQLSPTPNSNSSISSCGSSSGNVNTAGLTSNLRKNSVSVRSCMAVGIVGVREENSSSTLYPSSPLDKVMPESVINSLNALTSQVANLPNTVQHMLLSDSLVPHKTGKDGGYQDHMREHLMQQSSHALPASQQKNRGISDTFSSKTTKEGIGTFISEIAKSEAGVVDGPALMSESPISGREGEEQFSGGEGERVRQMSGASSSSEPTGYYPLSQNHRNQVQPQTEQGGQHVEMDTVTHKSQALITPSVPQPRKTEHETRGSLPKSPSSSSPSSLPPSAQPSPNLPSSCPPVSLVPTFSSPSPSLISCFPPSHVMKAGVDSQNSGREREKEGGEGESMKDEESEERREWKHGKETKVNSVEERDGDKHGGKEEVGVHTHSSKRKQGEQEKQEKANYLEDSNKSMNTEEMFNTGVGVIVSTRPEIHQSGTITEPQTATGAAPHSLRSSHTFRNCSEEALSHSSAGDSNNLNGEDGDRLFTYSSNHGTKVPHKLSTEHSLSPLPPSSETQKVPSSELRHGPGIDLKTRGRGGMGTNVKYQGYHQSQPSYNSGPKKGAGIAGVDDLSRRGHGTDAGRGQEYNSQLQQQLQQPSLLQEVLQGYHLDRRYGRTENSTQKTFNAYSQPQNTAHARHPYVMPESARPHVLLPQTGIQGDHQLHTHTSASGKRHPPNLGQGSEPVVGPDTSSHSLCSGGSGAKEEHCSVAKHQIGTSRNHSTPSTEQSTESVSQPPPKHINLADYSLPHRRPSSNLSAHNSAVQQILLQDTEPLAGVPKSQTRPHASASTSLSSMVSSERRSVICDISPSCHTTPERERDGEVNQGRCHPQTGSSIASVIQQSHSTPSVMQEPEKCKVEKSENKVGFKLISKTTKEAQNITSNSAHFPAKDASVQHQNRSPCPSVDTNSDSQRFLIGRKGESNSISSFPCHSQQATQRPSSNLSPLSSPPSRCQPFFQGLDEASGQSTGLGRYGLGEARVGTPKAISYQPQYPSHPHHNVPSQAQLDNPKSLKLQMYPHPHSLNQSHVLDERCEWTASNNNRSTENIMMSPRSGRPRHQSPPGQRSQDSLPATQHHLQGNYYDSVKMWGLSERNSIGTVEGGSSQRNQLSATSSGAVALPATPASSAQCVESNPSREELVKSLHQVPASISHNQPVCSNNASSSSTNVNLGMQPGQGQNRTVGSGDPNPLMMRRRVRSFISPIPAKRQHQDQSQHHQRGSSSQFSSPLPNTESKHLSDASSSPDQTHTKMSIPNAPSPTPGKTKILPPRKGRGLKLEAIVQKITPNVKKTSNNNSHTDSASNHLSGLPNAQVTDCNPEIQEQDTCAESNFPRIGSCLPYLGEGLSLDEIMYYRGVEETGPLPPTAYPCDPHQDPQILKRDATANITRGAIGDLESDFGINTSVSPMTERDGVVERGKDELQIDSDFPLLGPLPPPPPLPRPVQASPPPSSSALSDIQHFTNTYQQLETRKGEHSAANLLRQKLQETGIGLGMDDYTGNDYFGTQPSHHNQNIGACLLTRAPHAYQQHLIPSARTASSMAGLSQLPEPKLPENIVPKGYFPSGKKKGRPVGSVNKQKRVQPQAHHVSLNTPTVNVTEAPPHTPTPTPAHSAAAQIVSSSSSIAETSESSLPTDNKISSASVSPAASQSVKRDAESEDVQQEKELKSDTQHQRTGECEEGDEIWIGSRQRRRRRRRVVGMVGKEEVQAGTPIGGKFGASGSFPDYRRSAFFPYIHVERKEEEMGAVCTIVNAEEELMKGENVGEGGTDVILTSISSSQGDREMENVRDKKETEPVGSALLESCATGKVLPSSGYVLSGAVITESDHFGQLLCCLCKKWANYKNLGDLYGPYYPPEYTSKLPKTHPQTRQSLLTSRAGSIGVSMGTISTDSTKQNIQTTEAQTAHKSVLDTQHIAFQDVDPLSALAEDPPCPMGNRDLHFLSDNISSVDADSKEPQQQGLGQDVTTNNGLLKQFKQPSELEEKSESLVQNQQWLAEEIHQRPQHRKLTSHPRFKRRHKSSEDLPKSTPTNNKALLPFQPPPQPLTQDNSEPLSQLAQLPQVPLDPEELWVHEGCIVWASGVYLVNGRLYGLKEALDGARDTRCSRCEAVGSTLGCYTKGCTLRYHYLCALEADCSVNEDNFSLRCLKHKFPLNSSAVKPVCPEQSERG